MLAKKNPGNETVARIYISRPWAGIRFFLRAPYGTSGERAKLHLLHIGGSRSFRSVNHLKLYLFTLA